VCFAAATIVAVIDMIVVPVVFCKCVIDDTRLLFSCNLGDSDPSNQHTRLLLVRPCVSLFYLLVACGIS
jgi:hypothetical protein